MYTDPQQMTVLHESTSDGLISDFVAADEIRVLSQRIQCMRTVLVVLTSDDVTVPSNTKGVLGDRTYFHVKASPSMVRASRIGNGCIVVSGWRRHESAPTWQLLEATRTDQPMARPLRGRKPDKK